MSVLADIADAIVTELNEAPGGTFASDVEDPPGTWTRAFEAERLYLPVFELKDMATLHVSVVPKAKVSEMTTRKATADEYQVDVAVQKQVDPETLAEVDLLMDLVQEIEDFFRLRRLTEYTDAVWLRTEIVAYSMEHLSTMRQFTALITLTYSVVR
jgi:hypothetical protein